MKLKPIDERVLIKPTKEEERKIGGIIIPDTASKERPQMGEIVAIAFFLLSRNLFPPPLRGQFSTAITST